MAFAVRISHHPPSERSRACFTKATTNGGVVVVGSINVDNVLRVQRLPQPGETLAASSLDQLPGGKGANQAAAASRLGCRTTMVGQVGSDSGADFMSEQLQQRGVACSGTVQHLAGQPTGMATVMLVPSGENSIIIVGGANTAPWQLSAAQAAAVQGAGTVLLQREIPESVNVEVARMCEEASVPVVLDAGGAEEPLDPELLKRVSVLSPNETELHRMTGADTGSVQLVVEACKVLQGQGAGDVLVKLGSKGSLMVTRAGEVHQQEPFKVEKVVDTTGAGDCFTAAYVVGRLRGMPNNDAMRFASAAAALCIQTVGAMSSMPADAEVQKLLDAQ